MTPALTNSHLRFLCLLLCIIVLFPIVHTGFTTTDDARFAIYGYEMALDTAKKQGRFNHIPIGLLGSIPYLFESPYYFQSVRVAFILLTILLFGFCVSHVVNSYRVGMLSVILCLGFLQKTWDHNLITSYPVALQFPLQFLFLSLILFKKYASSSKRTYGLLAAVFYFCAILHEAFIAYFPLFFLILWQHIPKNTNTHLRVRILFHRATPIIAALLTYLILYTVWRMMYPSTYRRNVLHLENLYNVLFTIYQYSISSLPGYYYFYLAGLNSDMFFAFGSPFSLAGFIQQIRVEWLVKACILFCATFAILYDVKYEKNDQKKLIILFLISVTAIFLPNALIGLTAKYQNWVFYGGTRGYSTTYYSYFATVLSIVLLFAYLIQLVRSHHLVKLLAVLTLSCTIVFFGFLTDYVNHFIGQDQRLCHMIWKVIDRFLASPDFAKIPEGSIIYSPSLFTKRGIVGFHLGFWSAYINKKTSKSVFVQNSIPRRAIREGRGIYFLKFAQEPHSANQFLIFGRMEDEHSIKNELPVGHEAVIFSYSQNRRISLLGFIVDQGETEATEVFIDELPPRNQGRGMFASNIKLSKDMTDFPSIRIRSNHLIHLNHFWISYFDFSPPFSSVSIDFRGGWSFDEITHRWCLEKDCEIVLLNHHVSHRVGLSGFSLLSPNDRTIKISFNSEDVYKANLSARKPYEIRLEGLMLLPGENVLRFETDTPPVFSISRDQRPFYYSIRGFVCEF